MNNFESNINNIHNRNYISDYQSRSSQSANENSSLTESRESASLDYQPGTIAGRSIVTESRQKIINDLNKLASENKMEENEHFDVDEIMEVITRPDGRIDSNALKAVKILIQDPDIWNPRIDMIIRGCMEYDEIECHGGYGENGVFSPKIFERYYELRDIVPERHCKAVQIAKILAFSHTRSKGNHSYLPNFGGRFDEIAYQIGKFASTRRNAHLVVDFKGNLDANFRNENGELDYSGNKDYKSDELRQYLAQNVNLNLLDKQISPEVAIFLVTDEKLLNAATTSDGMVSTEALALAKELDCFDLLKNTHDTGLFITKKSDVINSLIKRILKEGVFNPEKAKFVTDLAKQGFNGDFIKTALDISFPDNKYDANLHKKVMEFSEITKDYSVLYSCFSDAKKENGEFDEFVYNSYVKFLNKYYEDFSYGEENKYSVNHIMKTNIENIIRPIKKTPDIFRNDDYINFAMKCFENGRIDSEKIPDFFKAKLLSYDYRGYSNISELSVPNKRNYIDVLLQGGACYEDGASLNLYDDVPILPRKDGDYQKLIKKIKSELEPPISKLSDNEIEQVDSDMLKIQSGNISISDTLKSVVENEQGHKISQINIDVIKEIVQRDDFKSLSDNDKKLVMLAAFLIKMNSDENTDNIYNVYCVSKKLGLSQHDTNKLLNILDGASFVKDFMATTKQKTLKERKYGIEGVDRENVFNYYALKLKDENNFDLAKMLYQSTEPEGLTRRVDRKLGDKVKELKSTSFILPQTNQSEIMKYAIPKEISGHKVMVVKASDIPVFCGYFHTTELSASSHQYDRQSRLDNFNVFGLLGDERTICFSYVGCDRYRTAGISAPGLICRIDSDKQFIGQNSDICSSSENLRDLSPEFVNTDKHKFNGVPFSISQRLNISKEEYAARLDKIKEQCGDDLSYDNICLIDKEFADALMLEIKEGSSIISNSSYNEYLVTNPRPIAIAAHSINHVLGNIHYLKKAEEENLPIIIFE